MLDGGLNLYFGENKMLLELHSVCGGGIQVKPTGRSWRQVLQQDLCVEGAASWLIRWIGSCLPI